MKFEDELDSIINPVTMVIIERFMMSLVNGDEDFKIMMIKLIP